MRKWWAFLCLMVVLSGCGVVQATLPPSPVVTQIVAEGEYEQTQIYRIYTSDEKMRQILLFIRALRPKHNANMDPQLLDTPIVTISVTHRDGAVKQYHLRGRRFFRENEEQWKKVDSEALENLYQAIWNLPSD